MIALVVGYIIYGAVMDKVFGTSADKLTPATTMNDGLDYMPIKKNRAFLIQFLNIAGTGPIFGAIAGAMWGPAAFMWIVFGCIFGGAVHDFLIGMMSLRHKGASASELVGDSLGNIPRQIMRVFSIVLLLLVGVVFVYSPADLLALLTPEFMNRWFWVAAILIYYILATLLPLNAIIGKIYPVFGISLFIMAGGIILGMIFGEGNIITKIPELTFTNPHPAGKSIFPYLFISIACGAVSGFHATQSPMMARCLKTERDGRRVFYGAMIAEGAIALIWAAAAMTFFGSLENLGTAGTPAVVVQKISESLMGQVGLVLAVVGVAVCPITSGDTAFRSIRLNVADVFKLDQKPIKNRLIAIVPIFAIAIVLLFVDFNIIWRYFSWANQTLAAIALWAGAAYLKKRNKFHWIALLPAMFMTAVVTSYITIAPEGFGAMFGGNTKLAETVGLVLAAIVTVVFTAMYFAFIKSDSVVSEELVDSDTVSSGA